MQLLEHFKELTLHPKNAEELKGLILQLAVQGKLTKQWRMEYVDVEPASVLLEKIKSEKERLVKEKTIKKEKPLLEISDEEIPSVLPNSWNWCKLIDLSIINGGFAFKSSAYNETGVRVIRISDFDESGFKNHKIVRHPYSPELEIFKLEKGNIIMAMTGGTVGKSLFVKCMDEVMVVNQRVATIKIIEPMFEGYVNCVLQTHLIQSIISEAKNSTNDNISMSHIKEFPIPLPPLEEQKAIVEVVNQLFAEVEQLEALTKERIQLKSDFVTSALNQLTQAAEQDTASQWAFLQEHFGTFFTEKENIKKLREGILQLAVKGKLTRDWRALRRAQGTPMETASTLLEKIKAEKEQLIKAGKIKKEKPLPEISEGEIPYELPEGWIWCRLGEVTTLKSGQDLKPNEYSDDEVIGIPYITGASNLQNEVVIVNRWTNVPRSIAYKGDLLLTCKGSGVGKMGWLKEEEAHIARQIMALNIINSNLEYLKLFLNTKLIFFKMAANGVIPGIDRKTVLEIPFPFPSLNEQKAIVEKVNVFMALCDKLEQEIETYQTTQEQWIQSCLREVV